MGENCAMTGVDLVETCREGLVFLCRKYAVKRLRLFGSAVKDSFDPASSDLDFLVEFNAPKGMNAFHQFMDLKLDMEELFGRRVDLVTWKAVKDPFFRENAEATAIDLYAA